MKLIRLLDKPAPSLLALACASLFVSVLLALDLLNDAPLWLLWGFYGVMVAGVAKEAYKISKGVQ